MSGVSDTPSEPVYDYGALSKKAVLALTLLLFILVPLAFTTHLHSTFHTIKLVLFRALLAMMIPFALYAWQTRAAISSRDSSLTRSLLVFLVVSFLASILSVSPLVSMYRFLELLSYGALYCIWTVCLERQDVRSIFRALMVSSMVASVYSLLQHCGLDIPGIVWSDAAMVKSRSISTFGNPTFLAGFLVMVLPLTMYLILNEEDAPSYSTMNIIYIISWILSFSAILMSYTRGAWCALLVSQGVLFLCLGKSLIIKHRKKLALLMALAIVIVFSVMMMQSWMKSGTTVMTRITSITNKEDIHMDRLFLWKIGIHNFSAHWLLGSGPGTFAYIFPRYRFLEPPSNRGRVASPEACHNEFIEIASSMGAAGLLSFLAVLGSLFSLLYKIIRGGGVVEKTAGSILAASAVAFLGHNVFLYPTITTELVWWLLLSLAALFLPRARAGSLPPDVPGFRRKLLMAAVIIFSLLLFLNNLKTALGSYYVCRAKNHEREGHFVAALAAYDRALYFEPLQSRYYLYRGKMLEQVFSEKPIAGLPEEIVKSYRMAIALNEIDPYPWADLGRFYAYHAGHFDRSSLEKAEESYSKAILLDPYNPLFYNDSGNVYAHLGMTDKAKARYIKGLELFPDSPLILLNLASLSWQRKEHDRARSYLERVLCLEPENRKALQLLKEMAGHDKKGDERE